MTIRLIGRSINFIAIIAITLVGACSYQAKTQAVTASKNSTIPQIVGNDRDAHNCIPSAGYNWSGSRNSCVRIWEVGTRLYEVSNPNSSSNDIVIENGPNGVMELFLASSSSGNSLLLLKNGNIWRDSGNYYFITKSADAKISLFEKSGKLVATSK